VKFALLAPAGTVTLAGTLAAPGRLLDSATIVPPAGAALGSVTVPVAGVPPATLVGLSTNEDSVGAGGGVLSGFTVKSADSVTPPPVTEMVTTVVCATDLGRIWMAPLVVPAGIVTLLERNGSTVVLLLLTRRNWSKDALEPIETVPWTEPLAPVVVAGKSVSEVGFGAGITMSCERTVLAFHVAVMVTVVLVVTSLVAMANEADGLPPGTVTLAGGRTAAELLDRLTTAPAAGACPFSIRIALSGTPPLVVVGVRISEFNDGGRTVSWTDAEDAPRLAVTVTTVDAVT